MINIYLINLFSESNIELQSFLEKFYEQKIKLEDSFSYEEEYENPIDMIEIISTLVDNNEAFNIAIWITLDSNIYINITETNLNKIIRYLFERYPY